MAGWTNLGKRNMLGVVFRNETPPTNFYVALVTSGSAPGADSKWLGEFTEIAAGNGYTAGGYQLNRNSTDFDFIEADNPNDRGEIQIKDVVWSASGGSIPDTGDGARYALLTDDDGTLDNREVWCYFDLVSDRQVSDGQDLTLQNCEMRGSES